MPTSTVAELSRVDEWLISVLMGDAALWNMSGERVYIDQAPQGAASPMVVASFLGGSDKILGSAARLTNALYLVRAIAQGSSYNLVSPLADRIEAVLTVPSQTGTLVGPVRLTGCGREQPHQRKDAENGVPYVYMGGLYRIRFQPASQ